MSQDRNTALLNWYRTHRRDLPWRASTDPWPVLVSEIMLQQTQVGRVVPVFERFMERFPTPQALATATSADVIDAWSDLGYLRRAFNLHRSAMHISEHGWPAPSELDRLPGVGPYTSAAVGSIAFGVQSPAVDTNLRRVLSRWAGRPLGPLELQAAAHAALVAAPASEWNQAIMDLSAILCRPRRPRCGECPVEQWCDDPTVQVVVKQQSAYEGSVRQARASILRQLAKASSRTVSSLVDTPALSPERVAEALASLEQEGAVSVEGEVVRLV